jgi:amino acid permease
MAKLIIQGLIFTMMCSGILYGSVCNRNLDTAWQFLSALMMKFGFVQFKYSNEETKDIDQKDATVTQWRYMCCAAMALLITPINFQRSLGTLRYFSMLILVVMMYTIILILVQFPSYYAHFSKDPKYAVDWIMAEPDMKWFQGFATFMLSFNCQVLFFYVRGEMMHKTNRRINKLVTYLMCICMTLFIAMCVAAYLSLGKNYLPKLFTLRRNIEPETTDYFMLGAQILFFIAAYVKIALLLFPAREQIYIFYKIGRGCFNHTIITVFMSVFVFAVPCIYPDVTNLLGLLGGVTIGTMGYLVPMIMKISLYIKEKNLGIGFYTHLSLMLGILIVQIASTYLSIASTVSSGH